MRGVWGVSMGVQVSESMRAFPLKAKLFALQAWCCEPRAICACRLSEVVRGDADLGDTERAAVALT